MRIIKLLSVLDLTEPSHVSLPTIFLYKWEEEKKNPVKGFESSGHCNLFFDGEH